MTLTEGVSLYNEGINPYVGDMFHETPLGLFVYDWMIRNLAQWMGIIFICCDLMTAHLLYKTACLFMKELCQQQTEQRKNYAKDCAALLLKPEDLTLAPIYVASVYLFNPYTIFNCVGQTTTVFANFCLAATFFFMIKGERLLCCLVLAFATLQSLYPILLLVPVCIYIGRQSRSTCRSVFLTTATFACSLTTLLFVCRGLAGNWEFLDATYGFILNVPDLRPNIGLFWYFFTEMFEHFRPLFICAFQINATVLYVVPLTFRLHYEPMLLAASLTALTAIFKSYPSLGDTCNKGLWLAASFSSLRFWDQLFGIYWIYSRSANANFYFGVTLAFATAQIFLITDILFAFIKREFSLFNGLRREVDGKPAKLVLD
uniref:(California timema) hypothetical protein n=1 Tax=Timema californicum TaxID=61474 RepID=A0A7R9J239_TIMCA|nr:unnamed protein product [Timema californicum]